jgi:hypothetical protein
MAHACLAHCVISAIETRTGARFGGACKATKHRSPAEAVQGFKNSETNIWTLRPLAAREAIDRSSG